MNTSYWQSELEKFEQNGQLFEPANLLQRVDILHALDQLFRFGHTRFGVRSGFQPILSRASELEARLDETNSLLFDGVREQIQRDALTQGELRQILDEFTHYLPSHCDFYHYEDGLDLLINGVFETLSAPEPSLDAVQDMVWLQMTPISVILELVDRIGLAADDTFVDIGSGQGQICLLVHLLTQVDAIGIEIDPAYVERAESVVRSICGETDKISFRQGDARAANYSDGTVFFMYTPFLGQVFHAVMKQLHLSVRSAHGKRGRPLIICTYGDITLDVAKLPWLRPQNDADIHPSRLAVFEVSD